MNTLNSTPQSPCISICTLDDSDECMGCARTLDEIIDWSMLDNEGKRMILKRANERMAAREQSA